MTDKPFYMAKDVQEATGTHHSTIVRWLSEGGYPGAAMQTVDKTRAWVFDKETYEALCKRAIESKSTPRKAMTVNPNRKKAEAAKSTPRKWASLDEMIANCRTARKVAPGVAEGAEVWA